MDLILLIVPGLQKEMCLNSKFGEILITREMVVVIKNATEAMKIIMKQIYGNTKATTTKIIKILNNNGIIATGISIKVPIAAISNKKVENIIESGMEKDIKKIRTLKLMNSFWAMEMKLVKLMNKRIIINQRKFSLELQLD